MPESSVRDLLKQLHDTLDGRTSIPEADRELLRHLSADIQALLERTGEGQPPTLADRLQAAITRFEVSHPDLTAAMARAAKTLGDMGI